MNKGSLDFTQAFCLHYAPLNTHARSEKRSSSSTGWNARRGPRRPVVAQHHHMLRLRLRMLLC